jgi:hypothetical protein
MYRDAETGNMSRWRQEDQREAIECSNVGRQGKKSNVERQRQAIGAEGGN